MLAARPCNLGTRGVAAVEFAMIAPVFFMVIFAIFDISYNLYVSSVLQGATNRAARAATMEGASEKQVDTIVTDRVGDLMVRPNLKFARKAYVNFTDVHRPEDFTDIDGNGVCNGGEPYVDANNSGSWEADRGRSGNGGARDAIVYEVTLTYKSMFPLWKLIGLSDTVNLVSTSVLRNQPWELQAGETVTTKNCT